MAAPQLQADVVVVGAGAAGLYCALTAASEGAQVALVAATPLADTASLLGPGRGRRRAGRRRLARPPSPGHAGRRPRAGAPQRRDRAVPRGAARRRASSNASACASTPTVAGGSSLGLEGGHSVRRVAHAGGSATGRRIVRQLSAPSSPRTRGSRCSNRPAPRPCGPTTAAAPASCCEDGLVIRAARHDPRDRRCRRAVVAHDEPAGLGRHRCACSRVAPARRWPTSS